MAQAQLGDVIAKALARQPGNVYSVIPDVVDRKPTYHVAIAIGGGKIVLIDIEGSVVTRLSARKARAQDRGGCD